MRMSWHSQARSQATSSIIRNGPQIKTLSTLAHMNGNARRHSRTMRRTSNPTRSLTLQCSLRPSLTRPCPFNWCTHRSKANLTLNSKLPLCTAKSINAATSSFSVAAVVSIRSSQRLFCVCIPADECQELTLEFDSKLTF